MASEKVGASRHNARTTPRNNPSTGSNDQPPTVFDGGGGSTTKEDRNKLVGEPPPIKKEGRDFCSAGEPCGSLWNTHSNKIALKLHLGYLFGISWPTVVTILRDYGVDHINQNIHDTERFVREELAQGRTIRTYAGSFMYLLNGVMDAEPELSPEAMRDRDVTLARDFEHLRKRKPTEKEKHAADYERWKDR
jgi:hypothetical protein